MIVFDDLNAPITNKHGVVIKFKDKNQAIDYLLEGGYKPAHIQTFSFVIL